MADVGHLALLNGTDWNSWRAANPQVVPDLRGVDLSGRDFTAFDLSSVDFTGAKLRRCFFGDDAFRHPPPTFCRAANFHQADLTNSAFTMANCEAASFTESILRDALFRYVRLQRCRFIDCDWTNATIESCHVFGVSVWSMNGRPLKTGSLNIASTDWPRIEVDDLETAQNVHLLQTSDKARALLEAISTKAVLILGRFSETRKPLVDAIRTKLRNLGFIPLVFDFDKPTQRDFTETVRTLTGLSVFVIADITQPRSVPLELQATIPNYMIPFVPILQEGESAFSMFADLQQKHRDWVMDVLEYDSPETLIEQLEAAVVKPAMKLAITQ